MVLAISRIEPGWLKSNLPYCKGYEGDALLAELPGARVLPEPGLLGRLARITELCTVDFRPLDAEEKKIIEGVLAIAGVSDGFVKHISRLRNASSSRESSTNWSYKSDQEAKREAEDEGFLSSLFGSLGDV